MYICTCIAVQGSYWMSCMQPVSEGVEYHDAAWWALVSWRSTRALKSDACLALSLDMLAQYMRYGSQKDMDPTKGLESWMQYVYIYIQIYPYK